MLAERIAPLVHVRREGRWFDTVCGAVPLGMRTARHPVRGRTDDATCVRCLRRVARQLGDEVGRLRAALRESPAHPEGKESP